MKQGQWESMALELRVGAGVSTRSLVLVAL